MFQNLSVRNLFLGYYLLLSAHNFGKLSLQISRTFYRCMIFFVDMAPDSNLELLLKFTDQTFKPWTVLASNNIGWKVVKISLNRPDLNKVSEGIFRITNSRSIAYKIPKTALEQLFLQDVFLTLYILLPGRHILSNHE